MGLGRCGLMRPGSVTRLSGGSCKRSFFYTPSSWAPRGSARKVAAGVLSHAAFSLRHLILTDWRLVSGDVACATRGWLALSQLSLCAALMSRWCLVGVPQADIRSCYRDRAASSWLPRRSPQHQHLRPGMRILRYLGRGWAVKRRSSFLAAAGWREWAV